MGSEAPYTYNRWFSQLSVKQIEDDRHVLSLNGHLANVCLESNDGHIKDTGNYKNLAEHSTFGVRVLGTHDTRSVDGNVHSVQNANNIPTFSDKTSGTKGGHLSYPSRQSFHRTIPLTRNCLTPRAFYQTYLGNCWKPPKD